MIYFEPMTTTREREGGSPEDRRPVPVGVTQDQATLSYLHRKIALDASDILKDFDPTKPFSVSTLPVRARSIVVRSIADFKRKVEGSDPTDLYTESDEKLFEYMKRFQTDPRFVEGEEKVIKLIGGLTSYEDGTYDIRKLPEEKGVTVKIGGLEFYTKVVKDSARKDARFLSFVQDVVGDLQGSSISNDEIINQTRRGSMFLGILYSHVIAEVSHPYLRTLADINPGVRPDHAGAFLKSIDILIYG